MAKREKAKKITAEGRHRKGQRGQEVVDRILELVRTGNLLPGDRLPPERELIEIFGISRPSLREGLRALDALGVTESRHGGGAFVTDLEARRLLAPLDFYLSLSKENMHDSFVCRKLIEVDAARQAARSTNQSSVVELQEMMDAHANVQDDFVGFRILDLRFHNHVWSLANNPILERICYALYNLGLDTRRKAMHFEGQIAKSTADHQRIVSAISDRDEDAAAEAMDIHIDNIAESTRLADSGP